MSLPSSWVNRIFDKLTLVYGHQFLGRWSGLDLDAVKADWAHELDGLQAHPEAITYALQNLPAEPANVLQFRAACIRAPKPTLPALPEPPASPGRVTAALAQAQQTVELVGSPAQRVVRGILGSIERRGVVASPPQKHMLRSCCSMLHNEDPLRDAALKAAA